MVTIFLFALKKHGHNVTECRWLHPEKVINKVDRGKKL